MSIPSRVPWKSLAACTLVCWLTLPLGLVASLFFDKNAEAPLAIICIGGMLIAFASPVLAFIHWISITQARERGELIPRFARISGGMTALLALIPLLLLLFIIFGPAAFMIIDSLPKVSK